MDPDRVLLLRRVPCLMAAIALLLAGGALFRQSPELPRAFAEQADRLVAVDAQFLAGCLERFPLGDREQELRGGRAQAPAAALSVSAG